ncbi:hypothetical protein S7711_02937 [Stachybotrys chartarum IBT 7711]|uniref:AAA+ ATPase lid domain-containing protein n=1 Tax=Stachybotrys chartarum (strain CBS 109288 / IBT 7711) TaxID=1280523 RepID=A0A084B2D0_STACB|nr:hypothetical protein S7711_02937 [Stachybotrys chartarum IBT 7711]
MNLIKIGAFIKGYWREYPFDRWNGRQIRNACLTAVALAEYEAQGEDPDDVLKPNAVVELKDSHLEDVAKTYLEFSEHMKDIYGTHAARRAKEAGLRAMWVDGKGKLVGNIGQKEAGIIEGSRKGRLLRAFGGEDSYVRPGQSQQSYHDPYPGGRGAPDQRYGRQQHGYNPDVETLRRSRFGFASETRLRPQRP